MNCFQKGNYELLRDLAVVQVPVLLRCLDWNSCCSAVLSCCYSVASAVLYLWMGVWGGGRHSKSGWNWGTGLTMLLGQPTGRGPAVPTVFIWLLELCILVIPQPWHSQNILYHLMLSWLKMQSTATATLCVQRGHSVYLWEQPVPQPNSGI